MRCQHLGVKAGKTVVPCKNGGNKETSIYECEKFDRCLPMYVSEERQHRGLTICHTCPDRQD